MCSGWLKSAELLELLSNWWNKDSRRRFHEFRVYFNHVELLETLSSWENKVHRRIFCEVKLVALSRTCLGCLWAGGNVVKTSLQTLPVRKVTGEKGPGFELGRWSFFSYRLSLEQCLQKSLYEQNFLNYWINEETKIVGEYFMSSG